MESQSGKTLYILKIAEVLANGTPPSLDDRQRILQNYYEIAYTCATYSIRTPPLGYDVKRV